MTLLGSDVMALVATIDPDAYAASTVTSDWVAVANYNSLMAVLYVGEMVATATCDAKLRQATDGSGTSAKDIANKAITQLTQAGSDSDKQAVINVREDELDVAGGFTHVALSVTLGTAGADMGAAIYGLNPTYGVASDNDLASVDEIVN